MGVQDGYGHYPESGGSGILYLIQCGLVSQEKVKVSHSVEAGVLGPHGCKYFPKTIITSQCFIFEWFFLG